MVLFKFNVWSQLLSHYLLETNQASLCPKGTPHFLSNAARVTVVVSVDGALCYLAFCSLFEQLLDDKDKREYDD